MLNFDCFMRLTVFKHICNSRLDHIKLMSTMNASTDTGCWHVWRRSKTSQWTDSLCIIHMRPFTFGKNESSYIRAGGNREIFPYKIMKILLPGMRRRRKRIFIAFLRSFIICEPRTGKLYSFIPQARIIKKKKQLHTKLITMLKLLITL